MNIIKQATNLAAAYVRQQRAAPDEARTTLPSLQIDGVGDEVVVVGYYYGEGRRPGPPQSRRIYFPFLEAKVNLRTMQVSGSHVDGKDFGLTAPADEYIGDLGDLLRFDVLDYMKRKDSYEELLSNLAEHRWLLPHRDHSSVEVELARQISAVLEDIREKALEPYYRITMRDLRAWIAASAALHQR
jgi:hypothetical protein